MFYVCAVIFDVMKNFLNYFWNFEGIRALISLSLFMDDPNTL
jgi:hypothetical protein